MVGETRWIHKSASISSLILLRSIIYQLPVLAIKEFGDNQWMGYGAKNGVKNGVGSAEEHLTHIIETMLVQFGVGLGSIRFLRRQHFLAQQRNTSQLMEHRDTEWLSLLPQMYNPIPWCHGVPLPFPVRRVDGIPHSVLKWQENRPCHGYWPGSRVILAHIGI